MAKPGLLTVGLFQFFWCWNDYFGPQIYASENPAAWTLAYGIESFRSARHANWNLTMAATILVMAPVVWLMSSHSNGVSGRRIIAKEWDTERLQREPPDNVGSPAGW